MNIPVFIVTGFLESGKTQFIKETINDPEFINEAGTLLIVCEEGEIAYEKKMLERKAINLVTVDDEEDLTDEFLSMLDKKYQPKRVMIEFNGMWSVEDFYELAMPDRWEMAQAIALIDSSTLNTYLANFKAIMVAQFRYADLIIVNRCEDKTDKIGIRRMIKPVNRKAQIVFEKTDGSITNAGQDIMPFDVNAPVITLEDDDYGLWYMNALEHPEIYNGKTIRFKGYVYKEERLPKGCIVPGRFAMTCCAEDTTFLGFMCVVQKQGFLTYDQLKSRMWVMVTAKMKIQYVKEYHGNGLVLYAESIIPAKEPYEKLVYFN